MAALRLPKGDESQAQARTAAIQQALKEATRPPLAAAVDCETVLRLARSAVEVVNPSAISDIAVAALLARAGLESAAENVEANLALIRDFDFVDEARAELEKLLEGQNELAEAVKVGARARSA